MTKTIRCRMKKNYTVTKKENLVHFLSSVSIGISKNRILSQIKRGEAKVNGQKVLNDVQLNVGDVVSFFIPADLEKEVEIVYQDKNIVIFDKPIHTDVEGGLTNRAIELFGYAKPVHRLDRNTMGLVVFALNDETYDQLLKAFKEKRVEKEYIAKTVGKVNDGIYQAYLFKDSKQSKVYIYSSQKQGSLPMKTGVQFETNADINIARIKLYTGRTHQIRAHLSYLGCPVLGDEKYGNIQANKKYNLHYQQLKSVKIVFDGLCSPLEYLNNKVFLANEKLD